MMVQMHIALINNKIDGKEKVMCKMQWTSIQQIKNK